LNPFYVKANLLYFFLTLALSASLAQAAHAAAAPDTNIVASFPIGFAQGICNDGTNTYIELTAQIFRRNRFYVNDTNFIINTSPAAGLTGFGNVHMGDPDCYQGYIYAPLEAAVGVPSGATNIDIAIFLSANLARCSAFSISNYQPEASAVCIDPVFSNSIVLFAANFVSASTNDGIYEYGVTDLTNLAFIGALPLNQNIRHIQGIICVDGMLYALTDNGPAGEIYQINPTNGVVVHLAQLNIAGQAEWEGLDYFQGYLVANEGATGTVNWFNFFGIPATDAHQNIAGSVSDGNNNPIVGVGVSAAATINGTNYQTMTVDTDSSGNYSLNVPSGNWSVAVNCSGGNDNLGNLGNYICPNNQNVEIAGNDATNNFIVQIAGTNTLLFKTTSLISGTNGVFYSTTLSASGGQPPYDWSFSPNSAGLPPNLSLTADGVLSGTAATNGIFNFSVRVMDNLNDIIDQPLSLNLIAMNLPPLAISAVGGQIIILWSASATNYVLQSATNLASPNWMTISAAVPGMAFTVSNSAPAVFFRLH
jgi:hypothetical protein